MLHENESKSCCEAMLGKYIRTFKLLQGQLCFFLVREKTFTIESGVMKDGSRNSSVGKVGVLAY